MSDADKTQIHELNLRYALHIDRGEVDLWVDTFSQDGVFDEREYELGIHAGHDQLRAFGQLIVANASQLMHIMTNHLVTDITADHANGTVYGIAEGVSRDGAHRRYLVFYEDEYVKVGPHWKIGRRTTRKKFPPEVLQSPSAA